MPRSPARRLKSGQLIFGRAGGHGHSLSDGSPVTRVSDKRAVAGASEESAVTRISAESAVSLVVSNLVVSKMDDTAGDAPDGDSAASAVEFVPACRAGGLSPCRVTETSGM